MTERILNLSGAAAALWMFFGVIVVARMIPGYRHSDNFMSELGAKGRPTEKLHMFINCFPIGILFVLFGITLFLQANNSWLVTISGILFLLHGFSHFITGLFPCDAEIGVAPPSKTQLVHKQAGLVMQLSLLIAGLLWALSQSLLPTWFRWFSLACVIASIIFFILMAKSFSSKSFMGLYQRLSLGSLMVWVAVLSGMLYSRA